MSNFLRLAGEEPRPEFPDDSVGLLQWRRFLDRLPQLTEPSAENYDGALQDPLAELRLLHRSIERPGHLRRPKVFISHRQCDQAEALRCAWLANEKGFEYWVDILDPHMIATNNAQISSPYQKALLLAGVIEMGLLNCTHVLAVVTKNAQGSSWIPYEYGRVKDSDLVSIQVAGWFDAYWTAQNTPEYFHLGLRLSGKQISSWFRKELSRWPALNGVPPLSNPKKPWPLSVPKPDPLPDE